MEANRKRRAVYPELVAARRCQLLVLGVEVGGRIGQEALGFVRQLVNAKARGVPARLCAAARQAHIHRWTGMLAVAAQRAFAMSLLELPPATADECDGAEPPLAEVLVDARAIEPIVPSRLPVSRGAGRDNHLQTQKGPKKREKQIILPCQWSKKSVFSTHASPLR